jgi:hypothetical protein
VVATDDVRVLLAYIPPTWKGSIDLAVDMTARAESSHGSWFGPTNGSYAEAPCGLFATSRLGRSCLLG